ncbi:MAG: ferredoxin-thioredoxin reductase catalytic domain-containing protein [Candidatus Pacebacteria bacterium]|nr:ferredoxin-thioredoxin reductase catalytic domain-containing protein [Candidatus Paceibacterota bacterium]
MEKTEEIRLKYEEYSKKNNISLNPNETIVNGIINGLLNNEQKYGEQYCPCRKVTGDKEIDKKIICPCIYHMDEIASMGHCHCNLFVKNI